MTVPPTHDIAEREYNIYQTLEARLRQLDLTRPHVQGKTDGEETKGTLPGYCEQTHVLNLEL